jgi:hypothetical protein
MTEAAVESERGLFAGKRYLCFANRDDFCAPWRLRRERLGATMRSPLRSVRFGPRSYPLSADADGLLVSREWNDGASEQKAHPGANLVARSPPAFYELCRLRER